MGTEGKTRELVIALGCVIRDDQILLTQRDEPEQLDLNLTWELPGGKVKLTETVENAVVREVREETGYEVEIADSIPFGYSTHYWPYRDGKQRAVLLCFECRLADRPQKQLEVMDHRVRAIRWTHYGDLDASEVIGGSRELITRIAQRRGLTTPTDGENDSPFIMEFEHLDQHKGIRKFYQLTVEIDRTHKNIYRLHRTWGRIGQKPRSIEEMHGTEVNLRRRLKELANQRIAHGYRVTRASKNFPLKDWLLSHSVVPIIKVEAQQLPLLLDDHGGQ